MVPPFRDLRGAGEIRASGSGASHDAHPKISRAEVNESATEP